MSKIKIFALGGLNEDGKTVAGVDLEVPGAGCNS